MHATTTPPYKVNWFVYVLKENLNYKINLNKVMAEYFKHVQSSQPSIIISCNMHGVQSQA